MNLGKLAKRLRKELVANPKQAAVLGIVCLVALWFWGPILLKWWGGKPPTAAKATASPKGPVAEGRAAKSDPQEKLVTFHWFDLQAVREADPLTRPAKVATIARNPFSTGQATLAHTAQEDTADDDSMTASANDTIDPAALGLNLESIAYGPSRRRAQINGQTLRENDTITWGAKGEAETTARLMSIHSHEVLLDVRGVTVRLELRPKSLGQGNVVQRTNSD